MATTLMLLNAPFPPDIRVQKEADALVAAGMTVHVLCLRKNGQPDVEVLNGILIYRIDAGKSNIGLAFWDVVMSAFFVHPRFYRVAAKLLATITFTHVHAHDLPMVGTALALRKRFGVRVIADLHENYPDALGLWFSLKRNPIVRLKNYLFMNADRWRRWERKAVAEADEIVAVVSEMKVRLVKTYGLNPDRVTVVQNSEVQTFIQQPVDQQVYPDWKDKFIIAYTGGIGPHRGVDTVVEGMALLKDLPVIFVLIGGGNQETLQLLRDRTRSLGLEQQVFLLGHQPFQKVFSYMSLAHANIIPHKSNAQNDHGLPHKLCQNMMVNRPVIVSSSAPLKRIVEQYDAGIVFEAENPASFAAAARALVTDPGLRERLAANGVAATLRGPFNWETDSRFLIDLYRKA